MILKRVIITHPPNIDGIENISDDNDDLISIKEEELDEGMKILIGSTHILKQTPERKISEDFKEISILHEEANEKWNKVGTIK